LLEYIGALTANTIDMNNTTLAGEILKAILVAIAGGLMLVIASLV